jgi:hypothetical protein
MDFVFKVSNFRLRVVILQPSGERFGIRCTSLLDGVSSLDFGPASRGAFFICVPRWAGKGQGLLRATDRSISKNDHNPVKQRTTRFDTIQSVVSQLNPNFTYQERSPVKPFIDQGSAPHAIQSVRQWPHC